MALRLAIVIHAEEEFDWDAGFDRKNIGVNHASELIETIDDIIAVEGKVILAMDYPFVSSSGGQQVVKHCLSKHSEQVEFAAHLHPWVNPPYQDENDIVPERYSYPGNLPGKFELDKLKVLTEKVEEVTGLRPKTYLAGRYGVGENTNSILAELGYEVDLSISAFSDFTHQEGPDFSHFSNSKFTENKLTHLPRTCSILSPISPLQNCFNTQPEFYAKTQSNALLKILAKLLRVKRCHLSPEGLSLKQMKQVTEAQLKVNQNEIVLSFHSPSLKKGLTPYVSTEQEVEVFSSKILGYINWFVKEKQGVVCLARDFKDKQ